MQLLDALDTEHDAQGAVVPAAVLYRIDMGPDEQRRSIRLRPIVAANEVA